MTPPPERDSILRAALARAGAEGWTWRCFERAAEDCGHDRALALACFPRGRGEALDAVHELFDRLAAERAEGEALGALPVRERIAALTFARLAVMAPRRAAARRLAAADAARCAWRARLRTVDAIWRLAGDSATGFDYYTKRATLAAVYGASLLCWLGDASADGAETRAFVERRIAGVMRLRRARAPLDRACGFFDAAARRGLRAAGARRA